MGRRTLQSQLLESNSSCADALTRVQNWYDSADLPVPAFDTSGYCRARKRLSGEFLDVVEERSRKYSEERIEDHHLWYGFRLKAIDGTSVKLLDTAENQAAYPQPSGQKEGCGYPVMGVTGVLDLATGTEGILRSRVPRAVDGVSSWKKQFRKRF